jgi:signal transduction histidine kinase
MRESSSMSLSLLTPLRTVPPSRLDRAGVAERLRLTVLSLAYAVAFVPAMFLAVLATVAVPLTIITVGFPMLGVLVPAATWLTGAHRAVSGALLGVTVTANYVETGGMGLFARVLAWARDSARWRDVGFCWYSATAGFVMSLLPVALLTTPIFHVTMALVFQQWTWLTLTLFPGLPVALIAWWVITPPVFRARLLVDRGFLDHSRVARLERRIEQVQESRTEALDYNAAEIRRIERDLHDGAQAHIVTVGMKAGLAQMLLRTDPDAAAELLREVQATSTGALENLRSLVRSIHPPVLADRGLAGGIEALALLVPLPVTIQVDIPRLPAPVESATYFAVSELLANIVKHSRATTAQVVGTFDGERLRLRVGDDGCGGADPDGAGMSGITRRLQPFDGTMSVSSPEGGPTMIQLEVPCRAG